VQPPFQSILARDYLRLAEYFEGPKDSHFPVGTEFAEKLAAQNHCFALEVEIQERLAPALRTFWPDRNGAVRQLLDQKGPKFQLHSQLRESLNRLTTAYKDWLFEERFPTMGMLASLRLILTFGEGDTFQPTLLDAAVLLLLLGQNEQLEGLPITNPLGIRGLTGEETTELGFRITCLYRMRNRLVTPRSDFHHLARVKSDAARILELLNKIHWQDSSLGPVA